VPVVEVLTLARLTRVTIGQHLRDIKRQ